MKIKFSKYVVISGPLDDADDIKTERIVFSTRTGKGIKITNYVISLIQAGEFSAIPDRLFTILMYHELIIPADEDELDIVLKRKTLTAVDILKKGTSLLVTGAPPPGGVTFSSLLQQQLNSAAKNNEGLPLRIFFHIASIKKMSDRIEQVRNMVAADPALSNTEVKYELVITDEQVQDLLDFLPLRNPYFSKLRCSFAAPGKAGANKLLNEYVDRLTNVLKVNQAIREVPVQCSLLLTEASLSPEMPDMKKLAGLTACSNLNLSVHIPGTALKNKAVKLEKLESELLFQLSANRIRADFRPVPDCKYHAALTWKEIGSELDTPLLTLPAKYIQDLETGFEDFYLAGRQELEPVMGKFYDAEFAAKIMGNGLPCSTCIFLPMCGGRADKERGTDTDCPVFIRNFMPKVKYMYNFSLENSMQ